MELKERKRPSAFLLFSLILFCFLAIFNIVIVAMNHFQLRRYEFSIVLWLGIVGFLEIISILVFLFQCKKKKQKYSYFLAGIAIGCTLISCILIQVEYFMFYTWYKESASKEAWNTFLTYSCNGIVLFLALFVILTYVIYLKKRKHRIHI